MLAPVSSLRPAGAPARGGAGREAAVATLLLCAVRLLVPLASARSLAFVVRPKCASRRVPFGTAWCALRAPRACGQLTGRDAGGRGCHRAALGRRLGPQRARGVRARPRGHRLPGRGRPPRSPQQGARGPAPGEKVGLCPLPAVCPLPCSPRADPLTPCVDEGG